MNESDPAIRRKIRHPERLRSRQRDLLLRLHF
jgi:hypothetical protein